MYSIGSFGTQQLFNKDQLLGHFSASKIAGIIVVVEFELLREITTQLVEMFSRLEKSQC